MYRKEKIQPNKLNAPILFIGTGGRGSDIIKGIAKRAVNDDTSNLRFVVMDTDANDLLSANYGVIPIQTSSTSFVGSYLNNDKDAKMNWFPENKMLDAKNVSEGAGQVRAISRLAINDIIKNGKIQTLYKAIDDLFLKDGGGLKQAVRVVIASTAAGGTGSGIAMEIGMLVRHYIKKNYPDAAVMIRGFLIMPGVMDTVIKTQSEKDSLRCNGYATIKEINAFMMKGSGFFDTVPELQRYKDLYLSIPSSSSGTENISNLPFDFCFLMDRTDSNAGNMTTLGQYVDYAAQSLYEQNIGPMRTKTSSMEDNVLKLCIDPERLGRCRFGGVGASVLKYPYEDIRDYIALNWARMGIIGSSANKSLTEEERKALLDNSWLQYDIKFKEEYKAWEESTTSSSRNEPTRAGVYKSKMESGADPKSGNDFTMMLWDKYLRGKIDTLGDEEEERNIDVVARRYIDALIKGVTEGAIEREYFLQENRTFSVAKESAASQEYSSRYNAIVAIEEVAKTQRFADVVRSFAKEVFSSKVSAEKYDLGEYMLERYLSVRGKFMHPNAARYMLYKLSDAINERMNEADGTINSFEAKRARDVYGTGNGDKDVDVFKVALHLGKEAGLAEMCEACDKLKNFDGIVDKPGERCNDILDRYNNSVRKFFDMTIAKEICDVARGAVSNLIKVYENFYNSFERKVPAIEKKKEDIVTKLAFKNGDCVQYVLGEKKHLEKITDSVGRPMDSGEDAAKLYARIFESLRDNSYIEARRGVNKFNYEVTKDIFDDIIVEYYKNRVDEACGDIIYVKSVIHALKLQHDVDAAIELDGLSEERKEQMAIELNKEGNIKRYILDRIDRCRNLASPGIKKKDNEEAREVNVVACNDSIDDGDGVRINDFIPEAVRSDTVSKYELRFFRSVYNIMPTQLAKLSAPMYSDSIDEFSISSKSEFEQLSAGDYFRVYQKYMDRIGPDSKTSAVITPHIDKRWNSISQMPELDMDYQKRLMRKIHKSMIYGFIYDRIKLFRTSNEDPNAKIYKYLNSDNDTVDLVVSNHTKCDQLYEVLDSLYFDRLAVATIRGYVNKLRIKNKAAGYRSYDETEFFKMLKEFTFRKVINNPELAASNDQVSLFTVVLMYCDSLPAQNKDVAEMKTMVEAIIEMIYSEVQSCIASSDTLASKVAGILAEQYNMLIENYKQHSAVLDKGIFSDDIVSSIYRTVCKYFEKNDVEIFIDKLAKPEED